MQHNYGWLNQIRLKVQALECRVQPGSWFMNGLIEMGLATHAGGRHDREPEIVLHNVRAPRNETIRFEPPAVQAGSTPDTVTHPAQLFEDGKLRIALTNDPLADLFAMGTSPRSRMVRLYSDRAVTAHPREIADVTVPSATDSTSSRTIRRAVGVRSGEAARLAAPLGLRGPSSTHAGALPAAQEQSIAESYGQLPLSFEQNVGQFDDQVDFVTRAGGMTTFLTPTVAVFAIENSESRIQNLESLHERAGSVSDRSPPVANAPGSPEMGVALYMEIVGGNPNVHAVGGDQLPGIVNYFIGNDPSQWHTSIGTFGRVAYADVYPGIDLVYYGNGGQLEYDFIVSPGADPNQIALNFAGADGAEVDAEGNLLLHTAAGDLVQHTPVTYQQEGDGRQEIVSRYVLNGTSLRFEVGAYDPARALVIDPLVMGYSTYLGGGDGWDSANAIAVDTTGNVYVTGQTSSKKFPITPGAFDNSVNGGFDVFVAKLSTDGTSVVSGTYLGGFDYDLGYGIAVDLAGNAYVTGYTASNNFPTTVEAFDRSFNGNWDAFVAKISADGTSLIYGTYLGGFDYDIGTDIAVTAAGNTYVTGYTNSTAFPTTPGAFDTNNDDRDAFVAQLDKDGVSLIYSTFLGESESDYGDGIAVDAAGNAYIVGQTRSNEFPTTVGVFDTSYNGDGDAFVAKVSADGASLVYATYLGGSDDDIGDGIVIDAVGKAHVIGFTLSTNFPATPGAFDTTSNGDWDAFVAKLSPGGTSLVYSTYLGGDNEDGYGSSGIASGISVDAAGNAYVTGSTVSSDFPTTSGAFDTSWNLGYYDAFVVKLNAEGTSLIYGTYLGGSNADGGSGIAVDAVGNVYVTGYSLSTDFPTTPGAIKRRNRGYYDSFVTKFAEV